MNIDIKRKPRKVKNVLKRRKEMKAAVPAESYILFIIFHSHLYPPAMSTVSSQVGAALFPSF